MNTRNKINENQAFDRVTHKMRQMKRACVLIIAIMSIGCEVEPKAIEIITDRIISIFIPESQNVV